MKIRPSSLNCAHMVLLAKDSSGTYNIIDTQRDETKPKHNPLGRKLNTHLYKINKGK